MRTGKNRWQLKVLVVLQVKKCLLFVWQHHNLKKGNKNESRSNERERESATEIEMCKRISQPRRLFHRNHTMNSFSHCQIEFHFVSCSSFRIEGIKTLVQSFFPHDFSMSESNVVEEHRLKPCTRLHSCRKNRFTYVKMLTRKLYKTVRFDSLWCEWRFFFHGDNGTNPFKYVPVKEEKL